MKKKNAYNEAVAGDEGFISGEGYPSCEGEPCANMADKTSADADTMAGEDGPLDKPADMVDAEARGEHARSEGESGGDALAAAVAEWQDKYLRLQAEFDNYRKRTLREKMDLVQSGGRDVLLAMLPVRDDVQRAVAAMEKSNDLEALRDGVLLIAKKFTETLRQKGVTEIEVNGKEFDPDVSEAVARFAAGDELKGRVVDTVQSGYMLGDKVLRFAKVVVGE